MHESTPPGAGIGWEAAMEAALARARAEQKPILLDFFKPD